MFQPFLCQLPLKFVLFIHEVLGRKEKEHDKKSITYNVDFLSPDRNANLHFLFRLWLILFCLFVYLGFFFVFGFFVLLYFLTENCMLVLLVSSIFSSDPKMSESFILFINWFLIQKDRTKTNERLLYQI